MNIAAEVFHPGEFIKEELEARGWTNADLAQIMGRHPNQISLIITGQQDITPETATQLSAAFGTSAQLWLNLQSAYNLAQVSSTHEDVAQRARFEKECSNYHDFTPPDNRIHPARPSGTRLKCPRCSACD